MAGGTIKIKWDEVIRKESTAIRETKTQQEIASNPEKKPTKNTSNDALNSLRKVATAYAFSEQLAGFGVNYIANTYAISGDTLKAERITTQFNNAKKYAQTGIGIALSVATGNPLIIAATAYGLAQQGIQLALQNQRYVAELRVETQRSNYYTERLVRNISEVR